MALGPEGSALESGEGLARGWRGAGLELGAQMGGGGDGACGQKVSSIAWPSAVTTLWDLALCRLGFPKGTGWTFWGPVPLGGGEWALPAHRAAGDPEVVG